LAFPFFVEGKASLTPVRTTGGVIGRLEVAGEAGVRKPSQQETARVKKSSRPRNLR
jgi:hypothetical protein